MLLSFCAPWLPLLSFTYSMWVHESAEIELPRFASAFLLLHFLFSNSAIFNVGIGSMCWLTKYFSAEAVE